MLYDAFKLLHVIGVIILIGNVTVTSFWKLFADRTGDPHIIAHAQRLVVLTDWVFTLGGVVLICVGGYGAVLSVGVNPFGASWLVWPQILFVVSGAIWVVVLIPVQARQARQVRRFTEGGGIPEAYRRDGRRWLVWGIIATVPLVAAVYVMMVKP